MPVIEDVFDFNPRDPLSLWQQLHPQPRYGFFLGAGTPLGSHASVYMSLEEPDQLIGSHINQKQNPLVSIEKELANNPSLSSAPRFVGFLGFDAGRYFDQGINRTQRKPNSLETPDVMFGDFRSVLKLDLRTGKTILCTDTIDKKNIFVDKIKQIQTMQDHVESPPSFNLDRESDIRADFHYPSLDQFTGMVRQCKQAIGRGDIYQANLSIRFKGSFQGDPIDLYRILCRTNPSPYACLLIQPDHALVSCSPELLLEIKGSDLRTRPIAGTRPRGKTEKMDRLTQGRLLLSPKERAEHIMLVDLERNDLGRVSCPGSIDVTDQYEIERYSHVMHIVSQVKGRLSGQHTLSDAIASVFPGGTITGCPKIKSIEIIEDLERESRGPFYGSAGYISWNGDMALNILIRTALIKGDQVFIQAGAGIVADSRPNREYEEILAKAKVLLDGVSTANRMMVS